MGNPPSVLSGNGNVGEIAAKKASFGHFLCTHLTSLRREQSSLYSVDAEGHAHAAACRFQRNGGLSALKEGQSQAPIWVMLGTIWVMGGRGDILETAGAGPAVSCTEYPSCDSGWESTGFAGSAGFAAPHAK